MKKVKAVFIPIISIALCALLGFGIYALISTEEKNFNESKVVEVLEAEITNLNITNKYSRSTGNRTIYLVSVYKEEISLAEVIEVSEKMYASLKIGDMVSVEKTTSKYESDGTYKIIGIVNTTPSN